MKILNIGGGLILVCQNRHGFERKCPISGRWSTLFLSSLTQGETKALNNLFK